MGECCPHCGGRLPIVRDAFCGECHGDLTTPPDRPDGVTVAAPPVNGLSDPTDSAAGTGACPSEPRPRGQGWRAPVLQLACVAVVVAGTVLRIPAVEIAVYGGVEDTLLRSWNGTPARVGVLIGTLVSLGQLALVRYPVRGHRGRVLALVLDLVVVAAGLLLVYGAYRVGFVPSLPDWHVSARTMTYLGVFVGACLATIGAAWAARLLVTDPAAPDEGNRGWGRLCPPLVGGIVFALGITLGLALPLARQHAAARLEPPRSDRPTSLGSANRDKIVGTWKVMDREGAPRPTDKKVLLILASTYVRVTFDGNGTMTVESGADREDVRELMRKDTPASVFTANMKYTLLAEDGVEVYDMPPPGQPGRFGTQGRALLRIQIDGQIMTMVEEDGGVTRLVRVDCTQNPPVPDSQ